MTPSGQKMKIVIFFPSIYYDTYWSKNENYNFFPSSTMIPIGQKMNSFFLILKL